MRMKNSLFLLAAALAAPGLLAARTAPAKAPQPLQSSPQATSQIPPQAPPQTIVATIQTAQTNRALSPYQYGMFIEELGPLVYDTLWSEMLNDRKFFYPVTAAQPAAAPARRGPFGRMAPRRWRPVGPMDAIAMDKTDPFVGEQSPRVTLAAESPRGIRQSGLTLVKGKRYVGYIYLRSNHAAKVTVSLVWGDGPGDRRSVTFTAPASYRKFSFHFTAGADSSNAAFEVTGVGTGEFHIGTESLMPADNIDGFRPEVIAQLRTLRSGFWRLPGGNFLSDFSWYNSIGDRDKRPPEFDYAWNYPQSNDVGMDDFMTLCRLIGVTPYITVNAGFGDAHSAAEEVEYINGSTRTRLGALRARNGHPAPYGVKFWNIGNEPWGAWELGRTDLKYYVIKNNFFAKAMRQVDPSITLLSSGVLPDSGTPGANTGKSLLCTDADWTCGFVQHSWGTFDGITEHWYASPPGRRGGGAVAADVPPGPVSTVEWARVPSNQVHLKAEQWEELERRFPQMRAKKIFMSIDEYAYFGGGGAPNLKSDLAYAMIFNEMLRHSDFLRMSAFTMGTSTLNISPTGAASLNALGLLFKFYRDHMGPGMIPVTVDGNSPQPPLPHPMVGNLPDSNAGSPTYPLDVFAALSPDRARLTVAVVNATDSTQPLAVNLAGARAAGPATLWELTGDDLNAANNLGQPPRVTVRKVATGETPGTLSVPPISVDMYEFPVAANAATANAGPVNGGQAQ